MSFTDKAKNKVQEVVGKAKKKIGEATDNKDMQAEGQADQTQAGLKQAGENVKDSAADAKDATKHTFKKN
ncbi:MAG: CsbD family protein [Actinomycetota bacterium]|nr:CsbD family protein [Actinomycetota bacterium]